MSKRIDDGFSTTITFSLYPAIKFYEKEVTPPGVEGGGSNNTTTMRNKILRTMAPKKLKTLSESSASVSYDPTVYTQVLDMVNKNQLVTVTFPDLSTIAFWGWLDEFKPGQTKEGEQPVANIKIIPSNQDLGGIETLPTITAGA